MEENSGRELRKLVKIEGLGTSSEAPRTRFFPVGRSANKLIDDLANDF